MSVPSHRTTLAHSRCSIAIYVQVNKWGEARRGSWMLKESGTGHTGNYWGPEYRPDPGWQVTQLMWRSQQDCRVSQVRTLIRGSSGGPRRPSGLEPRPNSAQQTSVIRPQRVLTIRQLIPSPFDRGKTEAQRAVVALGTWLPPPAPLFHLLQPLASLRPRAGPCQVCEFKS